MNITSQWYWQRNYKEENKLLSAIPSLCLVIRSEYQAHLTGEPLIGHVSPPWTTVTLLLTNVGAHITNMLKLNLKFSQLWAALQVKCPWARYWTPNCSWCAVDTVHGGLCHQWGPCDELATCPALAQRQLGLASAKKTHDPIKGIKWLQTMDGWMMETEKQTQFVHNFKAS